MAQKGDPRPDWAKLELDRARRSETYRALRGLDRALALALWAHASQYGPIPDEDGDLSVAACGLPAAEVRAFLPRADFYKLGDAWMNDVAHEYYVESVEAIRDRRRGGLARQAKLRAEQRAEHGAELVAELPAELPAQHYPLHSVVAVSGGVNSVSVKEGEATPSVTTSMVPSSNKEAGQLSLAVEIPKVEAPRVERLGDLARTYLTARHWRLHGSERVPHLSEGMVASVAKAIGERLRDRFPAELIVAMPLLPADNGQSREGNPMYFMLKDPATLLRTDNAQGGKSHLRRYEAELEGMTFGRRQHSIAVALKVWEWLERAGVKLAEESK